MPHPYEPESWYDVEAMWRATGAAALRRWLTYGEVKETKSKKKYKKTYGEVKDRYLVAEAEERAKAAHLWALGERQRRLKAGTR